MSMTIHSVPPQVNPYGPAQDASLATTAPDNAFAAYAAPATSPATAGMGNHQGAIPAAPWLPGYASSTVPSTETARLQVNVELVNLGKSAVKELANQLRDDPTLGIKPGETVRTFESALDFVVGETKKSGLYDALVRAAIRRLKDSGNYESVVGQILAKEAANGRPRDRAWAESWIQSQYDYDRIGQNYVADAPYFKPADPYTDDVMRSPFNRGSAMLYGDGTGPRVQGSFAVTFYEQDGALMYKVRVPGQNGKESAPRPYDPNGTVIKEPGLYAELLGVPAPGDEFIFSNPVGVRANEPKMRVDYYDAGYRRYVDMDVKVNHKAHLFNTLFNPVFPGGNIPEPADQIRRAIS
jgi:hypothetical protein